MSGEMSRRELLGRGGALTGYLGTGWVAAGVHTESTRPARKKRVQANDKIVIALIGAGGMGRANTEVASSKPEIEVAALCNVEESPLIEPVNNRNA